MQCVAHYTEFPLNNYGIIRHYCQSVLCPTVSASAPTPPRSSLSTSDTALSTSATALSTSDIANPAYLDRNAEIAASSLLLGCFEAELVVRGCVRVRYGLAYSIMEYGGFAFVMRFYEGCQAGWLAARERIQLHACHFGRISVAGPRWPELRFLKSCSSA